MIRTLIKWYVKWPSLDVERTGALAGASFKFSITAGRKEPTEAKILGNAGDDRHDRAELFDRTLALTISFSFLNAPRRLFSTTGACDYSVWRYPNLHRFCNKISLPARIAFAILEIKQTIKRYKYMNALFMKILQLSRVSARSWIILLTNDFLWGDYHRRMMEPSRRRSFMRPNYIRRPKAKIISQFYGRPMRNFLNYWLLRAPKLILSLLNTFFVNKRVDHKTGQKVGP